MNRQMRMLIYGNGGGRRDNVYPMPRRYNAGRIGYGEQDMPEDYGRRYDRMEPYDMDEGYRGRQEQRMGYAGGYEDQGGSVEEWLEKPLTIGEAMRWAENLPEGPHWKTDEVKKLAPAVGISSEGVEFAEFYAWVNALYSDYHGVLQKYGLNRPEVYAEMAKCTMKDKDAVPNKGAVYYRFIVDEK